MAFVSMCFSKLVAYMLQTLVVFDTTMSVAVVVFGQTHFAGSHALVPERAHGRITGNCLLTHS